MHTLFKLSVRARVAALSTTAVALLTLPALAEEAAVQDVETVVVTGHLVYRDRAETVNPVLKYDLEFFQRFEPSTVGDMLKRVPSVAFLSDMNEFDGVRFRGLPPGYSKILINGEKVPGSNADRSFWVDRIPAELVERIEIIRAPSADTGGEGVGGTLNVVLRNDASIEGGFARVGANHYWDDKVRANGSVAYAGKIGESGGRFWLGADIQGRRTPKDKVPEFFDEEDVFKDEVELEEDIRDGKDYSFSGAVGLPVGQGQLDLNAFYVRTERDEDEFVQKFEEGELDEVETQAERIKQDNFSVNGAFKHPLGGGEMKLKFGYSRFKDDITSTAMEGDTADELELDETEMNDTTDEEIEGGLSFKLPLGGADVKFGIDGNSKKRDVAIRVFDDENEEDTSPRDVYLVKEKRIDPYAKIEGSLGDTVKAEAGLRYEHTKLDVTSNDGETGKNSYGFLLPSAHLSWDVANNSRVRLSVARTVRRQDFDLLAPFVQEEEPGDEDEFIGNPDLDVEKAWGLDVGLEQRFGKQGIFGVNFFYRRVTDVIELTSTGEDAEEGGEVFTASNVGKGKLWGVEFDLSTPLDFIGLPDTGIFANASLLDSSIVDPLTGAKRRFADQPKYVFNGGFQHNIPDWGVALGASYRKQGKASHVLFDEIRDTTYGGDLEAFVEKRFADRFVLRASAKNLLDAKKRETIYAFDGDSYEEFRDNILAGSYDEIERERERAGVIFQVTLRAAF